MQLICGISVVDGGNMLASIVKDTELDESYRLLQCSSKYVRIMAACTWTTTRTLRAVNMGILVLYILTKCLINK